MFTGTDKLKSLFQKINNVKVALYGDFCLDSYWLLDPRGSEISLETGLHAQAVTKQHYSLGGASNVAANLAALNPKEIKIFGIYGNDIFGKEMVSQLKSINVDTSGLVIQENEFETYTFCKRILNDEEQARIDFGTYNKRSPETDKLLFDKISEAADEVDIFIINQQVPGSITNSEFIDGFNKIIEAHPEKIFIMDSRHFSDKFQNVSIKVNDLEAAKLNNGSIEKDRFSNEELEKFAHNLYYKNNKPVFITRGENGIMAYDESGMHEIPGLKIDAELDIVGAGDTVLSAIACALAAGYNMSETIEFANFAAGVTVQKLLQTGTANEEEILSICSKINYNS